MTAESRGRRPRWTWTNLEKETNDIYGDTYDLSLNDKNLSIITTSSIKIRCTIHDFVFTKTIMSFINRRSACLRCKGSVARPKWTRERFLKECVEIHGDIFDLTSINQEHITGYKSNVPITCKICLYYWKPSITDVINCRAGCPSCAGSAPWTLERFKEVTRKIHGEKFDISNVKEEHIKNRISLLPITCNTCGDIMNKSISNFITHRSGCAACIGLKPWERQDFISRTEQRYPNQYDLTEVPNPMCNTSTKFPVTCKICKYRWMTNVIILYHHGCGCRSCNKTLPWTYDRFKEMMNKFYSADFDISEVTKTDIINGYSSVKVLCKNCGGSREAPVRAFLSHSIKCNICTGLRRPWTLERLHYDIKSGLDLLFDFSKVKDEHLVSCERRIPITCRTCNYFWYPKLDALYYNNGGCIRCNKSEPWTYERLLEQNNTRFPGLYDIISTKEDTIGYEYPIKVACKKCNLNWEALLVNFIRGKSGCKKCYGSLGERLCIDILERADILYESQLILESLPGKRFDFIFIFRGKRYIIEYDGIQHFRFVPYFHGTLEIFSERQRVDLMKTKAALMEGYHIIRIDYTNIDSTSISKHLNNAMRQLNENDRIYYSDPSMYEYISDNLVENSISEPCSSTD